MLIVVVLGMHKSGTSLVSEMLHRSGIEMIEADGSASYDEGQHFERAATSALNKRLLKAGHLHSLETVTALETREIDPAAAEDAAKLVEGLSRRQEDWGFKDPRTCLVYPFWKAVLPEHKLVCVFRNPLEVYQHYRLRDKSGPGALHAWYVYNKAMLDAYRAAPESSRLLLDYNALMQSDEELAKLGRFLGRPIADRRDHQLRRNRPRHNLRSIRDMALYWLKSGNNVARLNRRLKLLARRSGGGPPSSRSAPLSVSRA